MRAHLLVGEEKKAARVKDELLKRFPARPLTLLARVRLELAGRWGAKSAKELELSDPVWSGSAPRLQAEGLTLRARAWFDERAWDKAKADLLAAQELAPSAEASYWLGRVYLETGRAAQALIELEASALLDAAQVELWFFLGEARRAVGDVARAQEGYRMYLLRAQNGEYAARARRALPP